ncbi:hypothetical protein IIE26_01795 [Cytobacillus oceanisediminis]|uniref:hypothetical protein n=1 Tax=Cytobacillus oceanisediminis TaxID=665099 RepID=UPI001864D987|nr:hypothetical protein [Cytobacillus oceanisediminis]QOK27426.1 hypothetical protein IIE26_01795 [Cytobacillus oceanisediminis]
MGQATGPFLLWCGPFYQRILCLELLSQSISHLAHTGIFSAHSSTGLAQFLRFSAINCFFGAFLSSFDAYRNIFSAFLNRLGAIPSFQRN